MQKLAKSKNLIKSYTAEIRITSFCAHLPSMINTDNVCLVVKTALKDTSFAP